MKAILLITSLVLGSNLIAQNIKDTIIYAPIFSINYGVQLPGADLKTKFGINSNLGISGGFKTKSNLQVEIQASFIFSQNVKDTSVVDHLQNSNSNIVTLSGAPSLYQLNQRGWNIYLNTGKIIKTMGPNQNSGLIGKFGIGLIRHKILIENQNNDVPGLSAYNLKYMDRLTFGLTTSQFIGYQHLSNNHLANFFIGYEVVQGFTRGMRDYQIDLMSSYTHNQFEILHGFKFGWVVPVYRKAPKEFYFD